MVPKTFFSARVPGYPMKLLPGALLLLRRTPRAPGIASAPAILTRTCFFAAKKVRGPAVYQLYHVLPQPKPREGFFAGTKRSKNPLPCLSGAIGVLLLSGASGPRSSPLVACNRSSPSVAKTRSSPSFSGWVGGEEQKLRNPLVSSPSVAKTRSSPSFAYTISLALQ